MGADLLVRIYKAVVNTAAERVRSQERNAPVLINVRDMPEEGLGKVRYVGAWAVKKVLSAAQKYICTNIKSIVPSTRKSLGEHRQMCFLLEEYIIASKEHLQCSSDYPETLAITEEKDYRKAGLLHIGDSAYEFFS